MSAIDLDKLQLELVRRLNNDPWFNDPLPAKRISVLHEQLGNILAETQKAVAGVGIYAYIGTPKAEGIEEKRNVGLVNLRLRVLAQMVENVTLNPSGKPAAKGAQLIMQNLAGWTPDPTVQPLLFRDLDAAYTQVEEGGSDLLVYSVNFTTVIQYELL